VHLCIASMHVACFKAVAYHCGNGYGHHMLFSQLPCVGPSHVFLNFISYGLLNVPTVLMCPSHVFPYALSNVIYEQDPKPKLKIKERGFID